MFPTILNNYILKNRNEWRANKLRKIEYNTKTALFLKSNAILIDSKNNIINDRIIG